MRSPRPQNFSGNSRGKRAMKPVTREENRLDLERSTDTRDSAARRENGIRHSQPYAILVQVFLWLNLFN